MTVLAGSVRIGKPGLMEILGDEGLRLFFPLAAIQAALWPFLWVVVDGLDMPLATDIPASLWHANEMIFGAFGAALIGFLTTAVPEWTDTPRLKGRALFALAAGWGVARIVGFLGADAMQALAAIGECAWLAALVVYVAAVSWRKRSTGLLGFLFWISSLATAGGVVRFAFLTDDVLLAQEALRLAGFAFLGLLGLALARITVPVTNLVLDPTERTSPFRPHPGRLNLASGLVAVVIAGEIAGFSEAVSGYLFIAAGAAFLDRVAEAFIGKEAFRTEVLGLAWSSLMAGTGLMLIGISRLGAPFGEIPALHLTLMGGLGLGILMVFSIAGLLHTGRPLGVSVLARVALLILVVAVMMRVLPGLGVVPEPPGPPYVLASVLWAAAFLLWLKCYWPFLSNMGVCEQRKC
jgi:uncharacterized protein involved in response to NO